MILMEIMPLKSKTQTLCENQRRIQATDDRKFPIDLAKNTEKERTPFRLGAPVCYRPKALERKNENPHLE